MYQQNQENITYTKYNTFYKQDMNNNQYATQRDKLMINLLTIYNQRITDLDKQVKENNNKLRENERKNIYFDNKKCDDKANIKNKPNIKNIKTQEQSKLEDIVENIDLNTRNKGNKVQIPTNETN